MISTTLVMNRINIFPCPNRLAFPKFWQANRYLTEINRVCYWQPFETFCDLWLMPSRRDRRTRRKSHLHLIIISLNQTLFPSSCASCASCGSWTAGARMPWSRQGILAPPQSVPAQTGGWRHNIGPESEDNISRICLDPDHDKESAIAQVSVKISMTKRNVMMASH